MKNNNSKELLSAPMEHLPAKTLFTSPLLPGIELQAWIDRNSLKIEKILNEEVTQSETKFE